MNKRRENGASERLQRKQGDFVRRKSGKSVSARELLGRLSERPNCSGLDRSRRGYVYPSSPLCYAGSNAAQIPSRPH